ncbi:hypothetical protein [Mycobacterium spongiae]|uniref:hypothetical protein n=1 Tax=Mycobacterium spongiae TaxID=886343 RepID=UPI001BAC3B79|nr:hypothetical protein [Mycobacterium spongiae]
MVAAALAIWLLVGVAGGHCGISRAQSLEANPQQLSTASGLRLATIVGHVHVADGSTSQCSAKVAIAVLPRSTGPLLALGMAAIVVATVLSAHRAVPDGRSPPSGPVPVIAGRTLLTRYCLARR